MNRKGMTLIEIVAGLLLLGLLGISFVLAVVPVTQGLFMTRGSVEATQKTHLALTRLVREFTVITNVVSGSGQSIVYGVDDALGIGGQRTVSWIPGESLLLNGVPLTDDVASFGLWYYAAPGGSGQQNWDNDMRIVEIRLRPQSFDAVVFTNRVYLRGLE